MINHLSSHEHIWVGYSPTNQAGILIQTGVLQLLPRTSRLRSANAAGLRTWRQKVTSDHHNGAVCHSDAIANPKNCTEMYIQRMWAVSQRSVDIDERKCIPSIIYDNAMAPVKLPSATYYL